MFAPAQPVTLQRPAPAGAVPCPLTETAEWHRHQAQRHRAQLPAEALESTLLVTAGTAWHQGWAEWHEQQAQQPTATF